MCTRRAHSPSVGAQKEKRTFKNKQKKFTLTWAHTRANNGLEARASLIATYRCETPPSIDSAIDVTPVPDRSRRRSSFCLSRRLFCVDWLTALSRQLRGGKYDGRNRGKETHTWRRRHWRLSWREGSSSLCCAAEGWSESDMSFQLWPAADTFGPGCCWGSEWVSNSVG